ncbi:unnamed protein product [Ectocarpus sp. CCAP 1310/34]|nr:unnamed protein product [Ectocarpus sp. CCAP 1310/34]
MFVASMDSMGTKEGSRTFHTILTAAAFSFVASMDSMGTKEGSRTFHTILTAAAFSVDDVDGAPSVSARRRAAALGVREQAFNFAAERAKKLLSDLQPTEATKRCVYWFWPRAKQSNAASEELLELMRQYWHTDEVSRQHGNSAERDMWKESKSLTAHRHPRRQLTEPGGGEAVYAKFLNWASYKSFKERQSDNFTDPGRTLFLSTRCKCLVLPAMEQCACKIHSQQVLYIEALANVDMTSHGECDCRWCNVDGGRRWRETWKHMGTFSDAIACPKVNLRAADPEGDSWMGRKPECNALDCAMCGFGGTDGIPICSKLETSEQTVVWKMFEDVITVPASADGKIKAKKLANQTVPKEGKLCDLWLAFKEHTKLYMAHHSIAKWQRHCHKRCLETFQDSDLVIETYAEKYPYQSYISMMMPVYPQTTLMVAIVRFNPQTHVDGDFHLHGLARMVDHYLRGDGSEPTAAARKEGRTPRIHIFTDGCGKQNKGRRNFRFLADSVRQLGFFIDHHFAATSHFKGCHDGIGGVAKNAMKRRERFGKRIMGADGVVSLLRSFFGRRQAASGGREIYLPNSILEGVEGTREMYHFAGANTPKWDGSTSTKGREDDCKLVLKSEGQGQLSSLEKSRLREVKVLGAVASRWKGQGAGLQDPISGEEDVTCRKVKRTYSLRTRLASCFCSACRRSDYEQCYVSKRTPVSLPQWRMA